MVICAPRTFHCAEAAAVIAEAGASRSVIILGDAASEIEAHAAEELAYFLSAVTGAEIRVVNSPVPGKDSIWLGTPETNPGIEKAGVLEKAEELSGQGFLLQAGEEGLVIAGREPLGVLFGTYGFLEEHVGMRWYFPGEHGEYRPYIPDLEAAEINEIQEPSFRERTVRFSRVWGHQYTPDTWNWISRNRLRPNFNQRQAEEYRKRGAIVTGGGHILHRMVPDELFDEHPEYFGLYDGERRKQHGHRGQPCTTHPDVIDLAVEYMLDWFEENPRGVFTINNNDYSNFCECADCTALDPLEEKANNRVSTRFFTFKNEVARKVWEEKPDARINTLAYQRFRLPPTAVEPDTRLRVKLCDHGRCFRHSLDDFACRPNAWFRNMFESWAEFDCERAYFPYYNMIGGRPDKGIISVPMEGIIARDMRYMKELGHIDWRITVRPPDAKYPEVSDTPSTRSEWRGNFRWYYMQAKLAWNIDINEEELLAELDEKFYGPAAHAMSRYHELIRELWENTPGHFEYGTPFESLGRTMVRPGSIDRLRGLLIEAEGAVEKGTIYEERVTKDRHIFEQGWVLAYEQYR